MKIKILNFVLIAIKMCSKWTKKNHLGHFDWHYLGSQYPIRQNTQNMAIFTENRDKAKSDTNNNNINKDLYSALSKGIDAICSKRDKTRI